MKILRHLLAAAVFFPSLTLTAADERIYLPGVAVSRIEAAEYESALSREAVMAAPAWSAAEPLPLSLSRAVEAAAAELRKVVKRAEAWEKTSIALERLRGTTPERWYFVITFTEMLPSSPLPPNFRPSVVQIPVDFSGRAGVLKPRKKPAPLPPPVR